MAFDYVFVSRSRHATNSTTRVRPLVGLWARGKKAVYLILDSSALICLEIHFQVKIVVQLLFSALGNTERVKMRYCLVLLCLFATQTACSSTAQKRVIKNFVNSLDEIDLDDPQWQNILEKVATKSDAKSTCLFFKNNKCLLL